jgi:hypothetical protein
LHKKNNTSLWAGLRRSLFPIRENWRFWIAFFGPVPLAFCWPWVIEPNLLNTLLFVTFYLIVVQSFTRYMLKDQIRVDRLARAKWRAEIAREVETLERDYAELVAMVKQLPPEQQDQQFERLKGYALKLLTLNSLLRDWHE